MDSPLIYCKNLITGVIGKVLPSSRRYQYYQYSPSIDGSESWIAEDDPYVPGP